MTKDYFALFGLTPAFDINLSTLEQHYRKLQSETHPDRFAAGTPAEKLQSIQLATQVNEAYQVLKKPASRAKYILSQQGIDATDETNTHMPPEFLMQQMEWRETLEDLKAAKDINGLDQLTREMRKTAKSLTATLSDMLDKQRDLSAATEATRKLIFIDKVCDDIHKAIALIED